MKLSHRRTWYHAALRIEAAGGFGWERWLGADGVFIGMSGFGASAPFETCTNISELLPKTFRPR